VDERERYRALPVTGVASATPIIVGFTQWRRGDGAATPIFLVGSDPRGPGLRPWSIVEGGAEALVAPFSVAVDRTYSDRLGIETIGETGEIRDRKVDVAAITKGIRSFTTTPYVFASFDTARALLETPAGQATYVLVRVAPGASVADVRDRLVSAVTDADVLTTHEFRERSRSFWLFGTGAGAALFTGAILGIVVGTVIVAQTLYASTKDHINEFATLRAIGSSGGYIVRVILFQALLAALIGFSIAALAGWIVVLATADTALPVVITRDLMYGLFALTLAMCVISAIAAIREVVRIDPAMVFTR
jgi:putative ABC transport system permease protein